MRAHWLTKLNQIAVAGLILISLLLIPSGVAAPAQQRVQLWFYLHIYLQNSSQFQFSTNLLTRAAAAGYTGVVLADSMLEQTNGGTASYNTTCLQPFLTLASNLNITVVPQTCSFGHSEAALVSIDKNFAEPQPVGGANFIVSADAQSLVFSNTFAGLTNGGFESFANHKFTGWDYQDAIGVRTFADTSVFHGSSGCSLRIDADPYGTNKNARVIKRITVQPWRQYHVRVWMQFANFSTTTPVNANPLDVQFLDYPSNDTRNFTGNNGPFATASGSYPVNQSWTQYDYTCNSMSSTNITFALGLWSNSAGHLWIDDVSVEEIALVNLVRRTGAPLRIYAASNTNLVYNEPADVNPITDPLIPSTGPFTAWHTPPTVTLPAGSALTPGQLVKLDYYAVNPINLRQVGACLTAPGVADYLTNNLAGLVGKFPAGTGFVLDIDESRHLNTCASCVAMGQSAGGMLAWFLGQCASIIHGISPNAPIYVWNDMYDPYHNAITTTYYFAGGQVAGSWNGVSSNFIVMNWNHPNSVVNTNSLNFFANRGNKQFITGYFDTGTGTLTASNELWAAQGVPGFLGLMYTTWNNNLTNGFSQLENYAAAAQPPAIATQPSNQTVSAGAAAIFAITATSPTTLTFQWQCNGVDIPGATNASLSIASASLSDNGAQFSCRASNLGGYTTSASALLTVNGSGAPNPGALEFSAATYSATKSSGSATITVSRSLGNSGAVTVNYSTSNGTGLAGTDYVTTSGTLTWNDGDAASKSFTVSILNHGAYTGDKTVNLSLSNPGGGATLGIPENAVLTLIDDQPNTSPAGTLQFSQANYSVNESGSIIFIAVTRQNGSTGPVSVKCATSDGTASAGVDYAPTANTLSWANGDTAAKTVAIVIKNDTLYEGNETVNLTLSKPTGGAILGTPNTAVLTIVDDDPPPVSYLQFSSTNYSVSETGGVATVTVIRTNGTVGDVSVAYISSNGSAIAGADYTAVSGTLTWLNGDASPKTFAIPILSDDLAEGDETVNLTLSNPSGGAILGPVNTAVLTIHDPPIDAWRFAKFGTNADNPAIGGDLANPSGDGIPNLIKYALNLDPLTRCTNGLPAHAIVSNSGTNFLALSFTRVTTASDLYYTVEVSDDLLTWLTGNCYTAAGAQTNQTTTEFSRSGTSVETIVVRDNVAITNAPLRFMRLRVERH